MLQQVVNYYNKYRRTILITGGLLTSTYLLTQYFKTKIYKYTSDMKKEQQAKQDLKNRFLQNQLDVKSSIVEFLPIVQLKLNEYYDIDSLILQLEQPNLDKSTKLELWKQVKVKSFLKLFLSIYLLNLLTLFTTIQLNLLGRQFYLKTLVCQLQLLQTNLDLETDNNQFDKQSLETYKSFLAFSYYTLNVAMEKLVWKLELCLVPELETLSLGFKLDKDAFANLTYKLRSISEETLFSNPDHLLEYCLPSTQLEQLEMFQQVQLDINNVNHNNLNQLLDETKDFIQSPDFKQVLNSGFDLNFKLLNTTLFQHLNLDQSPNLDIQVPLVKWLPILTKANKSILNIQNNQYLKELFESDLLKGFAAIVYASFQIQN